MGGDFAHKKVPSFLIKGPRVQGVLGGAAEKGRKAMDRAYPGFNEKLVAALPKVIKSIIILDSELPKGVFFFFSQSSSPSGTIITRYIAAPNAVTIKRSTKISRVMNGVPIVARYSPSNLVA